MTEYATAVTEPMSTNPVPDASILAPNSERLPVKNRKESKSVTIKASIITNALYDGYNLRYELETKGYSIKMEYINQGKAAKAVHEEKLVALKAELVEVEALKAEKERQKKEAEEPEQAALEKYRLSEQENVQHKEEEVHNKQETEASDVIIIHCCYLSVRFSKLIFELDL